MKHPGPWKEFVGEVVDANGDTVIGSTYSGDIEFSDDEARDVTLAAPELLNELKLLAKHVEEKEQGAALSYGEPWEYPGFKPSSVLASALAFISRIEEKA